MRPAAFVVAVAALGLTSLSAAPPARADIPPPNTQGCHEKKVGSPCTGDDGKRGACAMHPCTSKGKMPNGEIGPVASECLTCIPSGDTTSGGSSSGGSAGAVPNGSSSGGSASSGGHTKSGCGVARAGVGASAAASRSPSSDPAFALACALGCAGVFVRRRRAR
jgi:hypothetical protein